MSGAGVLLSLQQSPSVQVSPTTAAAHSLSSNLSHYDKVRTIFIMGLPEDIKERELQNFLRWLPGFKNSHLSFKGDKPKGLALFSTVNFTVAAKDVLQKMVFDVKLRSLLHIEMARKNLTVKRVVVINSVAFDKDGGFPVPPVLSLPISASVQSHSVQVHVKAVCCDGKSAVNGVQEV
ncbi:RNA-binding protein with multiple splicing 2-like [Hibiscus syriacus]|nr:RNA-binding protein with multiple splicing 2-like [Hibiscus syriacus]